MVKRIILSSKFLVFVLTLISGINNAIAQKPQWVGNTPRESNSTYKFVEIISNGSSIGGARSNALSVLAQDEQLSRAVEASVNIGALTKVSQKSENGKIAEKVEDDMTIDVKLDGKSYRLQAQKVDEYVEGERYGEIILHTLYMVALCDNPKFDKVYLTTSYGFTPVIMSVIPGFGQWHKGSKTKGICMFAAEAATVAGIIVCENQRASYIKKANEQPKFAKEYSGKADNWETGRNICIGIAAGVWVYNLIDAAVAKGTRRVIVKSQNGGGLSVAPFVTNEANMGLSFSYRF